MAEVKQVWQRRTAAIAVTSIYSSILSFGEEISTIATGCFSGMKALGKCPLWYEALKPSSTAPAIIFKMFFWKWCGRIALKVNKHVSWNGLEMRVLSIFPVNRMWFRALGVSKRTTTYHALHCIKCSRNWPVVFRGGNNSLGLWEYREKTEICLRFTWRHLTAGLFFHM